MERFENVAMPLAAATVAVPESVPPPGFVAMARVTFAEDPVTVFPNASWIVTWIDGAIATPAVALEGCTLKASLLAPAASMLNALEPAPVRPVELAFKV